MAAGISVDENGTPWDVANEVTSAYLKIFSTPAKTNSVAMNTLASIRNQALYLVGIIMFFRNLPLPTAISYDVAIAIAVAAR
jgi:hypothetical protein